jgi:archaellum component FlaC
MLQKEPTIKDVLVTLDQLLKEINQKFEKIDQRFEKFDQRFEEFEGYFIAIKEDINRINVRLSSLDDRVSTVESRVTRIDKEMLTKKDFDKSHETLRDEYLNIGRKQSEQAESLVEVLHSRKVITAKDRREIFSKSPFDKERR